MRKGWGENGWWMVRPRVVPTVAGCLSLSQSASLPPCSPPSLLTSTTLSPEPEHSVSVVTRTLSTQHWLCHKPIVSISQETLLILQWIMWSETVKTTIRASQWHKRYHSLKYHIRFDEGKRSWVDYMTIQLRSISCLIIVHLGFS